jgi:hypothetical protein
MKKRSKFPLKLIVILIACAALFFLIRLVLPSAEKRAVSTVDEFYTYEQKGDFSASWELFHPDMKKKFDKGPYIQDRAHVFLNHFGVNTFSYELGKAEKLEGWRMADGGKAFPKVYKVTVTQTYKGKYGNFELVQDVFAAEMEDGWRILWDYKQKS